MASRKTGPRSGGLTPAGRGALPDQQTWLEGEVHGGPAGGDGKLPRRTMNAGAVAHEDSSRGGRRAYEDSPVPMNWWYFDGHGRRREDVGPFMNNGHQMSAEAACPPLAAAEDLDLPRRAATSRKIHWHYAAGGDGDGGKGPWPMSLRRETRFTRRPATYRIQRTRRRYRSMHHRR